MNKKAALLLLGCPELPVQMSLALYFMGKLKNGGINVVVAGKDAALNLLKVLSPEGYYVDIEKIINIDKCIESLAKTVHNPLPLKKKIDDRLEVVKRWAVSN